MGDYIMSELKSLKKSQALIKDVRGQGLMIGIVLNEDKARHIVEAAIREGLLVNTAQPNVIRLLPPLIVTKAQAKEAITVLKKVMDFMKKSALLALVATPDMSYC